MKFGHQITRAAIFQLQMQNKIKRGGSSADNFLNLDQIAHAHADTDSYLYEDIAFYLPHSSANY